MVGNGVNGWLEFSLRLKINFNDIHNQYPPSYRFLPILVLENGLLINFGLFHFEHFQFSTCEVPINLKLRWVKDDSATDLQF